MKDDQVDYLLKIVMVGDTSVGKSNLLSRYVLNEFCENSKSTIGVDFVTKDLLINDKMVKAQIWDTAGQEKFRSLIKNYYSNANGFILVYDVSNKKSFENLQYWLEVVKSSASPDAKILFIGNKIDLEQSREVNSSSGRKFAESEDGFFVETSAKTNPDNGVETAFMMLIEHTLTRLEAEEVKINREGVSTVYRNSAKKITPIVLPNAPKKSCCNN